jgi:hypothetical protein
MVGLLGVGGLLGYQAYSHRSQLEKDVKRQAEELKANAEKITTLTTNLAEQTQRANELELANRLLKVDHRLAHIRVLDQATDAEGRTMTKLEFVEVNDQGEPIDSPRITTIDGDVVYIDAWVVKFQDKLVEAADALRSTSICLFRRLFSETQKPVEGYQLDRVGAEPAVYRRGEQTSAEEQKIWSKFWDYANDPKAAEKAGVRAAHGEAPSIKLKPGKLYKVELRASGGLSIVADDAPSGEAPL